MVKHQSLQVQYNRRVMSAYYVQNVCMCCHVPLEIAEIHEITEQYKQAAIRAKDSRF